jgi:hypothetical protein
MLLLDMKKSVVLMVVTVMGLMLAISFVSAFFHRDVRLEPTDVGVTVNAPPTIVLPVTVPTVTLLSGTFVAVAFQFTAEDIDGESDLDDLTATASFSRAGEITRNNVDGINDGVDGCTFNSVSGPNQRIYDCTVSMMYFDDDGTVAGGDPWIVTASIGDFQGETGQDTDTFEVNLLQSIALAPGIINFPVVVEGGVNYNAIADTVLTNLGNFDADGLGGGDGPVTITAVDLFGETPPYPQVLSASQFDASDELADPCLAGTTLGVASQPVTDIDLPRGDGTGGNNEGSIDFCLTLVPIGTGSNLYTARLGHPDTVNSLGPWTIDI